MNDFVNSDIHAARSITSTSKTNSKSLHEQLVQSSFYKDYESPVDGVMPKRFIPTKMSWFVFAHFSCERVDLNGWRFLNLCNRHA